jgi:hypothetical protein
LWGSDDDQDWDIADIETVHVEAGLRSHPEKVNPVVIQDLAIETTKSDDNAAADGEEPTRGDDDPYVVIFPGPAGLLRKVRVIMCEKVDYVRIFSLKCIFVCSTE